MSQVQAQSTSEPDTSEGVKLAEAAPVADHSAPVQEVYPYKDKLKRKEYEARKA